MTEVTCPQCGRKDHEGCLRPPSKRSCFYALQDREHWSKAHSTEPNKMKALLDEAAAAVVARGKRYGEPEDNFKRIARRWSVHMLNRYGIDISLDEVDVASMMIDVKQARLENDPTHRDSWVDIAGYAAGGGSFDQTPADAAWDEAKKKREAVDTL
jgi:hypothetical protein